MVLGWVTLGFAAPGVEPADKTSPGLLDLPMEDLMKVEIVSTAALTKTQARLVPAAVTTITREQIQGASARSLFELLDIYVPNLQWARNDWEAPNLGLRGIINDRDDKYLLLVNGRVMNEHTHYGAFTERDLVTLRDINHIDVIRGSGSALYGPGAISMVINIVTDNANTYQGTEVFGRAGAMEEFSETEFKHGQKWQDGDGGLFLYAGTGHYTGASWDKAPQKFSIDFPDGPQVSWDSTPWMPCDGLKAGQAVPDIVVTRDGAQAPGSGPIKLHAEVTKGDWDVWARYTRGGQQFSHEVGALVRTPYGWGNWSPQPATDSFYAYQQATGFIGYKRPLADTLTLDTAVSYTMTDCEVYTLSYINDAYREDDYYGKAMLQWQPQEKHKVAFGTELLHGEYGYDSLNYEDIPARSSQLTPMPRWSTELFSLLGEWQWTINDQWRTFVGGRLDKNTYTDWMVSPRVAVVYAPTSQDTLKLIWSRSVRAPLAEDMKKQDVSGGGESKPETLDGAEFRYERQQSHNLDLAASLFWHYNFELISWSTTANGGQGGATNIGTQKDYGVELEASYHTDKTRLTLSHAYTQLYDFSLVPGEWTFISAKAFGYGNDLTGWSNHVTKLAVNHKLDDEWTFDGSLRIYWGFPGLKDYAMYKNPTSTSQGPVDPNYAPLYAGNYYLNAGLQYKPSKTLTVGLMGYYLLGVIDQDLNKRNDGAGCGYRDHAPAVSLWASYKFR
jgi:iron complex outermembrane receptor protein